MRVSVFDVKLRRLLLNETFVCQGRGTAPSQCLFFYDEISPPLSSPYDSSWHCGTRPCVRLNGGTAALVPAYDPCVRLTMALRHSSLRTTPSWHGGTCPRVRIHGDTEIPASWHEQCRICNHSIPQIHLPLESPVRLCGDTVALLRVVPHAPKKLLVF